MQIHVYESGRQANTAAAMLFAAQILSKPGSVLGLATGSTPIACYQHFVKWHREGLLDFSKAISFNLDEYCGLPATHPCSYHTFMRENLFDHVNLKASYLPDGNAPDMQAECARYDAAILAAGGIDIQFLGIGRNGHIGFNEPADRFVYGTQEVRLTQSTIDANRRFFDSAEEVPTRAISLGIGGIMASRKIVLVALGKDKAQAIRDTVLNDITPLVPASILRTHNDVSILLDKEAASLLG